MRQFIVAACAAVVVTVGLAACGSSTGNGSGTGGAGSGGSAAGRAKSGLSHLMHTPAQLKTYLYGDQNGTTGLAYITNKIQPTKQPKVFDTLDQAAAALEAGRIDALVTDTPTAQFMAASQLKHTVLVGQFPTVGEHYGLVFTKGNALVTCVNKAIASLQSDGTLTALQKKYFGIYLHFPTIKP